MPRFSSFTAFIRSSPFSNPVFKIVPNQFKAFNIKFARTLMSVAAEEEKLVKGKIHPNGLAIITLDRPKALNAMNIDMDLKYAHYLAEWDNDPHVKCVLVESSSPRAFCAGGDVKQITMRNQMQDIIEVFTAEYSLVCKIHDYKKPYISLMDGVTMGFGIGLSGHGRYQIVTERIVLAMHENGIGLFPDVGFSYIAAHSPGEGAVGAYLGLTGARISSPADALYVGIGTHYVSSGNLASLKESLLALDFSGNPHMDVNKLLTAHKQKPESESQLKKLLSQIVSTFDSNRSVSEIIKELEKHELSTDSTVAKWAANALEGIRKGAPFSLCLTQKHLSQVASARNNKANSLANLNGVMKMEYCIALRSSVRNDFVEGVRAVLVDRDQKPKWQPSRLEDVDMAEVESLFDPLPSGDELKV